MAKVKIQGNASGTGVITLIAPNTNTDRTVTLPDESITLGGGVDGIVSTANATAITIDSSENTTFSQYSKWSSSDMFGSGVPSTSQGIGVGGASGDKLLSFAKTSQLFYVAGAEKLKITSDGRGLSQFTAKAWCHFNMATPAIRDSHNVSSITDNATGNFFVNFSNNFANDDYAVMSGTNYMHSINNMNESYVGSTTIKTADSNHSAADADYVSCLIFGD